MKLAGSYTFDAPRESVWELLMDPTVLQRIIPGCERLEEVGPDTYSADIKLGIANIRGDYTGTVKISEQQPPASYHMEGEGRGKPGFAKGSGGLELTEVDGKTAMRYQADVQVGGPVAGIGQRLIEASAKSIINQSLKALSAELELHRSKDAAAESPPDEPAPDESDAFSMNRAPAASLSPAVAAKPSASVVSLTATDVARGIAEDMFAQQQWMRWVVPFASGFLLGIIVGIFLSPRQR